MKTFLKVILPLLFFAISITMTSCEDESESILPNFEKSTKNSSIEDCCPDPDSDPATDPGTNI